MGAAESGRHAMHRHQAARLGSKAELGFLRSHTVGAEELYNLGALVITPATTNTRSTNGTF